MRVGTLLRGLSAPSAQPSHPVRTHHHQLHPQSYGFFKDKAATHAATGAHSSAPVTGPTGPSPSAGPSWQGLSESDVTPPDPTGATGPSSYIEMVNDMFGIYTKSGSAIATGTLTTLTGEPSADGLSDPQIMWDPATQRFYYTAIDVSTYDFAYGFSKTSNPQNASDFCQYDADFQYGANLTLPDYPKLGDTKDFILIGVNSFFLESAYVGSDINWLAKPSVGTATITTCPAGSFAAGQFSAITNADTSLTNTPVPVQQADANSTGWVVGTADVSTGGSATFLSVFSVTNNGSGNAVLSPASSVTVPSYTMPPSAPQPGTSRTIDTLDGRLEHAISAVDPRVGTAPNAIWTAHAVAGGAGSEERWYEINPASASLIQSGKVTDSSLYVWNGAISPDRADNGTTAAFGSDMVMGFDTSSSSAYPTIAMVSKLGTSPQSAATTVQASTAADADFSCTAANATCRWGDYSGASPDPGASQTAATGRVYLSGEWDVNNSNISSQAAWRTWNWAANLGSATTCGKDACATSPNTIWNNNVAANAIDGNTATWWQPVAGTVSPTIEVEVAPGTSLSAVRAQWYGAGFEPQSYVIETSPDGVTWTTQVSVTANSATDRTDSFPVVSNARYFQIVVSSYPAAGGDPFAHLALSELSWDGHGINFPIASSPNTIWNNNVAANAIDGNTATWFQTIDATPTPTITVNLGTPTTLTAVRTQWYAGYAASGYQIQTSSDGVTWTTQVSVTGNTSTDRTDTLTTVTAQYLQLLVTPYTPNGVTPYSSFALTELGWNGHGA
jgi:hypothetical protein